MLKPPPTKWPDLMASLTPYIRRFAMGLTKDYEEAQDLTQDVLLKLLQSEDKFQPGTNLKAWICTITKNLFITNYQRKKKQGAAIEIEGLQDRGMSDHSTRNGGESEIFEQEMNIALDELPPRLKSVLVNRANGYKYDELAAMEGVPVGTIKNRIHVGRRELEQKLKRTQTTILSIPMKVDDNKQRMRDERWQGLFDYTIEKIQTGKSAPLVATEICSKVDCSMATAGQMLVTLIEMKALTREFFNGRYEYSFGEVNLSDIDKTEAQLRTSRRINPPKSVKAQKKEVKKFGINDLDANQMAQFGQLRESFAKINIPIALIPEMKSNPDLAPLPLAQSEPEKPVKYKPLGYYIDLEAHWFESDEQAITAAKERIRSFGAKEIVLVRQEAIVTLEPKVEFY